MEKLFIYFIYVWRIAEDPNTIIIAVIIVCKEPTKGTQSVLQFGTHNKTNLCY